jgi:hypothetical protein
MVRDLERYRRIALWAVYGAIGFVGIAERRGASGISTLAQLGFLNALLFWWAIDARICGKNCQHGWALVFPATMPVSLVAYLVWSRGARAGLASFAKAMGVVLVVAGASLAIASVLP